MHHVSYTNLLQFSHFIKSKTMKKIILMIFLLMSLTLELHAQVGIGTTTPSAKSILDLTAIDKGFLLPRMSTAQRLAIAPNNTTDFGMQVFDTTTNTIWFWNGTLWVQQGFKNIYDSDGNIPVSTLRKINLSDRVTSKLTISPVGEEAEISTLNVIGGQVNGGLTSGITVASNYTENTNKLSIIKGVPFNNSHPPVIMISANNMATENNLYVGGINSLSQASPTRIFFNVDGDSNLANTSSQSFQTGMVINGGSEKATIGIGTLNPTSKLEVHEINTTAFQNTLNVSSDPSALTSGGFNDTNPNISKASSGIQFLGWNGKKEGGIFRQTGSSNKSHLMFTVNSTNDVAMSITQAGNIGIGTLNPTSKVEIAGKTKTTNFQMTDSPTIGAVMVSDEAGNASWDNTFFQKGTVAMSNGSNNKFTTTIQDGFIKITGANACSRNLISLFAFNGTTLIHINSIARNSIGVATSMQVDNNTWKVEFSGVTGCGDGGSGPQFDFTISKNGNEISLYGYTYTISKTYSVAVSK
jgi:hypothetical protein